MEPLTDEEKNEYREARVCHLCRKRFEVSQSIGDRKVRDHCHYTGKYRGAAHSSCNLAHRIPKHVPVVFHNLSNYDAHIIIRELAHLLKFFAGENYSSLEQILVTFPRRSFPR